MPAEIEREISGIKHNFNLAFLKYNLHILFISSSFIYTYVFVYRNTCIFIYNTFKYINSHEYPQFDLQSQTAMEERERQAKQVSFFY